MSLWTPYSEEAALDLRVTAPVKSERVSPVPDVLSPAPIAEPHSKFNSYMYPQYPIVPTQNRLPSGRPAYCSNYAFPQQSDYTVPLAQMSPNSNGSYCSGGYESSDAMPSVSPSFVPRHLQSNEPSPPQSPESYKGHRSSGKHHRLDLEPISDDPEYQAFERDALRAMAEKNGGSLLGNNPRMRRAVRSTNQNPSDDSYREQRERNNFAAKQSRDRRKLREVRLALEVTYLSKQVSKLKAKLAAGLCDRCHM